MIKGNDPSVIFKFGVVLSIQDTASVTLRLESIDFAIRIS